MSYNDTEIYILQTIYGIIPKDLWDAKREASSDPLAKYSELDQNITKRKFRKLKRRAGVNKRDSAKVAWSKINWYLTNKCRSI